MAAIPLKIAMLFDNLTISGGGQRLLLSLAQELTRYGHRVTIFTVAFNPHACYPDLCRNLDIRALRTVTASAAHAPQSWTSRAGKKLHEYFVEPRQMADLVTERYDILNPHERPIHRTAVLLKRKWGTPIVWMFNDPGSWEINYYENDGMPAATRAFKAFLMRRADQKLVRQIDRVTVLSHGVQAIFHREFGVYPYVVRCGIDHGLMTASGARDELRKRLDIDRETVLVLFLAVLSPSRRVQDLIEAVAQIHASGRKIRVAVVGSSRYAPEYLSQLKDQATRLGIYDQVTFVSQNISEAERIGFFQACDIFAWPNEAQSWGLAPLEAMLFGKPAIVSMGAGVHEVLRDGETALLVPPRRPDLLGDAITRLIEQPELRTAVAERGNKFVEKNFSWPQFAGQMLPIFEEAVKSARKTGVHEAHRLKQDTMVTRSPSLIDLDN